jgi:hypothetical protein
MPTNPKKPPLISRCSDALRKISSKQTWWLKRVFPVVWFGFCGFLTCISALMAVDMVAGDMKPDGWLILPIPAFMLVFGHFYSRRMLYDLADEVVDTGDSLVVRRDGLEVRIPLADIVKVETGTLDESLRVVLTLRTDTRLGRKIAFMPARPFTLDPGAPSPIVAELRERIEQRTTRT